MKMETKTSKRTTTNEHQWEYGVLAVNNAGEGQPSNTVMAVL